MAFRFLWVLFLAGVCFGAEDKWVRLKSPNFELYTNSSAAAGRETLRRFEQIRHVFETRTQSRNLSPLPVRIFLFKSDSDFRPFQIHQDAAGYYQAGTERDYIAMQATGPDLYRVVFHEYVHLILRHAGYMVPVWFNEGTAELYSTVDFSGSNIKIGDLIQSHIVTLRTEKMLDIGTLMTVDHKSPHYNERGKTGIFYAQSWALAHMLNFSPDYQPGMARFIELLLSGEKHQDAFRTAFSKSEKDVLKDLSQYIRRDRFVGLMLKATPMENLGRIAPDEVNRFDSDLVLADLMLAVRKEEGAQRIYDGLAREYPNRPEVYDALGGLAMRQHNDAGALRNFEKAIELLSKNARLYFDYAMLLREKNPDDERVVANLHKAVEIDPALFDGHHVLGYLSLRSQKYDEAIEHLKKALELQPMRSAIWEYLALAYHYSGDREKARSAAKTARSVATTPEEIARTEATLQLVEGKSESIVRIRPMFQDPEILATSKPPVGAESDEPVLRGMKSDSRLEGTLIQVDCLGSLARLHIATNGSKVFLLVRDPGAVHLKNAGGTAFEFTCGAISPRRVIIEYNATQKTSYGTVGDVTTITFR